MQYWIEYNTALYYWSRFNKFWIAKLIESRGLAPCFPPCHWCFISVIDVTLINDETLAFSCYYVLDPSSIAYRPLAYFTIQKLCIL